MRIFKYENGLFIEKKRTEYIYSNYNLTGARIFMNTEGVFKQVGKVEITYNNGDIEFMGEYEIDENNNWTIKRKRIYEYSGSRLKKWTYYIKDENNAWAENQMWVFSYKEFHVLTIEYWAIYFGSMELERTIDYFYNDKGYLVEYFIQGDESAVTYEYEKGDGNNSLIQLPESKILFMPKYYLGD